MMLMIVNVKCAYDFTHHAKGKELLETLVDEPKTIFVLFWFKDANDDVKKINASFKNAVKQKLLGSDVAFSDVDVTDEAALTDYKKVATMLGMDQYSTLLDDSPIVALCYNRKGYWIHAAGVAADTDRQKHFAKEVAETVQGFVKAQENSAKKSSSASAVSFGGASRHSSDRSVSIGGL